MEVLPQNFCKLSSVHGTVYCRKDDFWSVCIKYIHSRISRLHKPDTGAFSEPLPGSFQILSIFRKHPLFYFVHTGIHRSHKNIGWAAGLIDSQKSYQKISVHPFTAPVKKSCLSHGRQGFMQTVDHNIRPKLCCRHRKIIRKTKMRSMGFIYDQRNIMTMSNLCNCFYIRYNSIIGRWGQKDCFDIRIFIKASFHTLRRNSSVYPQFCILMWINIGNLQITKISCMINCFVTVPCDQNMSAFFYSSRYGCQNCPGASIDTEKTLLYLIEPGGVFLCFL